MRKIKIEWNGFVAILLIFYVIFVSFAITSEKGTDLIIAERDGWIIVNTNPEQPMSLNPYSQPRLSIEMKWMVENIDHVEITLTFLYLGKRPMCPEAAVFAGGGWQMLGEPGRTDYREQRTKGGVFHRVIVKINPDVFMNIGYLKNPIRFRVCGVEFNLHDIEYWNIKQAMEIWRRR